MKGTVITIRFEDDYTATVGVDYPIKPFVPKEDTFVPKALMILYDELRVFRDKYNWDKYKLASLDDMVGLLGDAIKEVKAGRELELDEEVGNEKT